MEGIVEDPAYKKQTKQDDVPVHFRLIVEKRLKDYLKWPQILVFQLALKILHKSKQLKP